MTQTPTDALRLVNPHKDITENLRQAAVDLHPWFVGNAKTFSVDCALPAYLNDAADEIERLRAGAPASPLPGGGWQDISTAPKDGTVVLTYGSLHNDGAPYGIGETPTVKISQYSQEGEFWCCDAWGSHEPVWWMPLPAAPTGAK